MEEGKVSMLIARRDKGYLVKHFILFMKMYAEIASVKNYVISSLYNFDPLKPTFI